MVAPIKRKEERGKRKEEGEKSGERQGSPALSGASHWGRLRRRS
jgi:hypothetical protein